MRGLLLAFLMAWTVAAQASNFWSKLWLTPDQRGERLMKQGDLNAAAQTFRDPRRKAYAELKAGNYRGAAHDLARSSNSDDLYNRGNALARTGQLQEAIKAYDAALRRDPHNHDAKHNRDLVERELQKRQQHKPTARSGNTSGKNDNSKEATGGKDKKNKAGNAHNQPGKNQAGKKQSGNNGQGKQGNNNGARQHNQGKPERQTGRTEPAAQANAGNKPGNDANQARRDAAAALDKHQAAQQPHKSARSAEPLSEQQLSQEQWLRQIPDDPGGLLRRKFMIEHMIRQREAQQ